MGFEIEKVEFGLCGLRNGDTLVEGGETEIEVAILHFSDGTTAKIMPGSNVLNLHPDINYDKLKFDLDILW